MANLASSLQDVQHILEAGHPLAHRLAILAAALAGGFLIRRDSMTWPLAHLHRISVISVVAIGSMFGSFIPAFFAGSSVGKITRDFYGQSLPHSALDETLGGPKTILGGLLFGFVLVAFYKRLARIDFDTSDGFARGSCLMMAIGRLGCIAQHCCFGIVVQPSWGYNFGDGRSRFPVQAVEALFLFALFALLNHLHRRDLLRNQRLFLLFAIYGFGRFFLEFLREPIADLYLGLGFYQWLALGLAITGCVQITWRRSPHMTAIAPDPVL